MIHLTFTPTPITHLEYFSSKLGVNIFCKRDDLFTLAGGGNKARMLQYILAGVSKSNCDVLVTAGGPCSNFNRACALMCAQLGVQMHLVEYTDNQEEFDMSLNYKLCKLSGVRTTRCLKSNVPETISQVLNTYSSYKTKFVYGGGKSIEGFYSYYEAVRELYEQNVLVDYLFIACGTGTTLTGICAGIHKYYPKAIVYAISVARNIEEEMPVLQDNMNSLNAYLESDYDFSNLVFCDQFIGEGYGKYDESLVNLIRECATNEGMLLDPTYSGKAFYGMHSIIFQRDQFVNKNVLFWNTGGIFNLLSDIKSW